MPRNLSRLFQPRSIAVVGGGAWCEQVIRQSQLMGYSGEIWSIHPKSESVAGVRSYRAIGDLPHPPDAVFIGVNRQATIDIVRQMSATNAGGGVCFASGFAEASAEDAGGSDLQAELVAAAGDMPILGPNCYGFINALDGALLWPDQHGCQRVERGVAILTQSSNISINLTMQARALPIAYMVTCGNMAQTSQAEIAAALLDDDRITAIGLHIEGFGNLREWEHLAQKAHERGVPLIAIKVGASEQAQQATVSHTASLAGSDAGAQAFLDRLGIPRLKTLPDFLETLKLLHCLGPLPDANAASISCSGGEASLIADMAVGADVTFPKLSARQCDYLRAALGPMVALGNPLDYHTYIWRDAAAMARAWSGMTGDGISMTLSIVDYPRTDATDWACATEAAIRVRADTGARFGMVASLPELMPEDVAQTLIEAAVVPFMGMGEALAAIEAAARVAPPNALPVTLPGTIEATGVLDEHEAKQVLAASGVDVPRHRVVAANADITEALSGLAAPFVVKGVGMAHKSDLGAVHIGVAASDVPRVAKEIGTESILIEEFVPDAVAELLIGVVRDAAHGFVLTLGAGGVMTELLRDTASLLLPVTADEVDAALKRLKLAPLLSGFRGKPGADIPAIVNAVLAVQSYVLENSETIGEVEINPLLCLPDRAVAVDALIRKA